MIRDIIFRGKRVDNGEWVYGLLVDVGKESSFIRSWGKDRFGYYDFLVFSETVGQYTGLKDKNGQKVFEGDILDVNYNSPLFDGYDTETINYKGKVIYKENIAMYHCEGENRGDALCALSKNEIEVIGNIHDNPELLEVKNE